MEYNQKRIEELREKIDNKLKNNLNDEITPLAVSFCTWSNNVDLFYNDLSNITKKDYTEFQPWLNLKNRNFLNNVKNEFKSNKSFLWKCAGACDKFISIFDEKALTDLKDYYKRNNIYKDAESLFDEYDSIKVGNLIHNEKFSDLIQVSFMLKVDSIFFRDCLIPELLKYNEKENNLER